MSNIQSQRWLIDRRHFLRGIGTTIALPLLDAMMSEIGLKLGDTQSLADALTEAAKPAPGSEAKSD